MMKLRQIAQSIRSSENGNALILVILSSTIMLTVIGALANVAFIQSKVINKDISIDESFQVAEAGILRYRWILAHNPNDYSGIDEDYLDETGAVKGHYTVTVTPPTEGSTIVTIESVGYSVKYPELKKGIRMQIGKPSYSEFGFITNSNIWFGSSESVSGRMHSNGGIRMDGDVDSLVTTVKETYICGPEHGCSNQSRPGIWGTGSNQHLWDFPVANKVDYDTITLDLTEMKTTAEDANLFYGDSGSYGYHVEFVNDGTFNLHQVTQVRNAVWGYDGNDWIQESNSIQSQQLISNDPIPSEAILFFDDKIWVSGEVNGRVTVAAAHLPENANNQHDIIIQNDITYYPDRSSNNVLGLVAQNNILVPRYSENDLVIDGALISQNGKVMRYHYSGNILNSIETYGTIITNKIWTWSWVSGGAPSSGYTNTATIYDPNLLFAPPPYYPAQDTFDIIKWEEMDESEL